MVSLPKLAASKSARFVFSSICKSLTMKRILNVINVSVSMIFSDASVGGAPVLVEMEPTARCNLRCFSCPTGLGRLGRPIGDMKYEDFKKVIDEIGDSVLALVLYLHGEPFLSKDIYKMISHAKKKGIFVVVSTNGNFLDVKKLVRSGLQYLIVCLDGVTPETYVKYRIGGNFGKVVANIESIVREKRRTGSRTPFLDLHFIANRYNEHETPKIKEIARNLGVDNLIIKKFVPPPFVIRSKNPGKYGKMLSFLPKAKEYRYDLKVSRKGICDRAWVSTTITWDGFLIPCCYDTSAVFKFGKVFKNKFGSVWNGEEYRSFRKKLANKREIPLCFRCPGGANASANEYAEF